MKLSPRTTDALSQKASQYYNPNLLYHNWSHAEEVMDESLRILNVGGRWTRHVNRQLLQIASAWHDAGHDHEERHMFETPEHYSAALMRNQLRYDLNERQLQEIEESILGTRYKVTRATMASIALHYGDMSNCYQDYNYFLTHSVNLWSEYGKPNWDRWRAVSSSILLTTAQEAESELPLIGVEGISYSNIIRQNVSKIMAESEPK